VAAIFERAPAVATPRLLKIHLRRRAVALRRISPKSPRHATTHGANGRGRDERDTPHRRGIAGAAAGRCAAGWAVSGIRCAPPTTTTSATFASPLADVQAALGPALRRAADFIVQTTVTRGNRAELERLVAWSAEQGAVSFNVISSSRPDAGRRPQRSGAGEYRSRARRPGPGGSGAIAGACWCARNAPRLHAARAPERSRVPGLTTRRAALRHAILPHHSDGKLTPCPYLPEWRGPARPELCRLSGRSSPLFRRLRRGSWGGKMRRVRVPRAVRWLPGRAPSPWTGDVLAADPSCAYEPGDWL